MMEELRIWAGPAAALLSMATAVWVLLTSPTKAVSSRVDDISVRLAKVENDLAHLPDTETFHQLALSVSEMRGDLKALTAHVESAAATSDRLEQWLLKQGK
ncbi:Protein of unknown function [Pleomorphomonas diazotrophica]|nr:DUF2730 family protein [Pleomorphomonas diazotrophica]SFM36022.1 Protein of unknown function [Pleomorphomonas diazotrophica]